LMHRSVRRALVSGFGGLAFSRALALAALHSFRRVHLGLLVKAVTYSTGTYSGLSTYLSNANDGDIIELVNDVATGSESLVVSKDITLRSAFASSYNLCSCESSHE